MSSFKSAVPVHPMGHDIIEVIGRYESIVIQISLYEHLLQLLVSHVLADVLGYSLELQDGDLADLVQVKRCEDFVYFRSAVFVAQLGRCQSQKLREVDASGLIFIQFGQDLVDELVLTCKAQVDEGLLELERIDHATAIAVEDIERQLDVLDFLERDSHGDVVLGVESFLFWCLRGKFRSGGHRICFDWGWGSSFAHLNILSVRLQSILHQAHPDQPGSRSLQYRPSMIANYSYQPPFPSHCSLHLLLLVLLPSPSLERGPIQQYLSIILLMSLIQPEDYFRNTTGLNLYWSELLRTVDEFDQLIELQKREIATCVREYYQKRLELVKEFSSFKDSLRFEGEVQKKEIYFVEMGEFGTFFKNYHHSIVDLIEKIILDPKIIAKLISLFPDAKKIKFEDFFQNIVFNVYPCYLPSSKQGSPLMEFMRAVLSHWPYNHELMRPTQYSLLDQAISGFMKAPEIVCYVEKIVSRFLQDASNCHMSTFAFDEEAIQNEMQIKKQANATFSLYNQPKKSLKDKLKNFFTGNKDDSKLKSAMVTPSNSSINYEDSFLSNISDRSDQQGLSVLDMMKKRQTSFFELIKKTTDSILSEQVPLLLCKMMACFDEKLTSLIGTSQIKPSRLKHYCYFLMTNLILSQLHNKFTISHQENGMNHADLQNISQIIKILNCLFQGITPQSEKQFALILERYQNLPLILGSYREKMESYYTNIIERGKMGAKHEQELLEMLLTHYERSLVISLNDLSIFVALLQNLPKDQTLIPNLDRFLGFMNVKEQADLFDAFKKNRSVKFKNISYSSEEIYFLYECRSPSMREVIDYYLTVDQPLADIPLIREILLKESNLKLQEALEIDQELKLFHKLPIKQIKGFLTKMGQKFKHLRVKDGKQLQSKFQESFRRTLGRSLIRKEWLLYYRSELSQRLGFQGSLMQYFTGELNSVQFYERMAGSFFDNAKVKLYLNIENNRFKVHKTAQDLKKIQISTLMVARDDSKTSTSNENYILRNSFKLFESIKDILRCISKNQITKTALSNGRYPEQFNAVFQQICEQIVSKIKDFISQKHIMQVLSEQKLRIIVVKKMQDVIFTRYKNECIKVERDRELLASSTKIDKELFWQKDLAEYGIDREFLVSQGVEKFTLMMDETNITHRLKHFGELFKIIFTVLGFTMAKNKISAEIVTPLVQYIIIQCPHLSHYECLHSLLTLKWRQSPEDSYHLTLYQSCLTYIRELMPNDYPLK